MGKRKHTDITVRGTTYATVQDAAGDLGVSVNRVLQALKRGELHKVGLGQRGKDRMPISIRGRVYKNADTAAKALGVTRAAIYMAVCKGRADRVGLPKRGGSRSIQFYIGNLSWPSRRSASLDLGFSGNFVAQALRRSSKAGMQKIMAAEMEFEARQHAAKASAGSGV